MCLPELSLPSALCLLPSTAQIPWESVGPGEKMGHFSLQCLWLGPLPFPSPGRWRQWTFESFYFYHLIQWLLISQDWSLFPPPYDKIQEVRIFHVFNNQYLQNIYYWSSAHPQPYLLYPLTSFIGKGIGNFSETNQSYQAHSGSRRVINLNRPICYNNELLKAPDQRDTHSPLVCGLEKRGESVEWRTMIQGAPNLPWSQERDFWWWICISH